jgi:3-oxoacyl-[acyl-carrier-protein] synthase-3
MIGIRSIGWCIPSEHHPVERVAADHGVAVDALRDFGLRAKAIPGPDDHPASLAARATRAALTAADLTAEAVDLLIFVGVTRDRPGPWIAAFAALHALGNHRAAGFDLAGRCPGLHDALWIAANLVKAGTFCTVAVASGDRFDYVLPASRPRPILADAVFSAGGGAAIVTAEARNEIAAFAHATNEDLSLNLEQSAPAGGSMWPVDARALAAHAHAWQSNMKVGQAAALRDFLRRAEKQNIEAVCRAAGFDDFDFIAVSPSDVRGQAESLRALGVGPDRFLLTLPDHGHMGPADSLVSIGQALIENRRVGPRLVMSTRSVVYANALAIRGETEDLGIRVGHA